MKILLTIEIFLSSLTSRSPEAQAENILTKKTKYYSKHGRALFCLLGILEKLKPAELLGGHKPLFENLSHFNIVKGRDFISGFDVQICCLIVLDDMKSRHPDILDSDRPHPQFVPEDDRYPLEKTLIYAAFIYCWSTSLISDAEWESRSDEERRNLFSKNWSVATTAWEKWKDSPNLISSVL
jgi:hypothetical protein